MVESFFTHIKPMTLGSELWEAHNWSKVPPEWWALGIRPLPETWLDPQGSMGLGALLMALGNHLGERDIPHLLLGDVLLVLVPPHILDDALDLILRVQNRLSQRLGQEYQCRFLKIGSVPEAQDLEVARESIHSRIPRALVWGRGIGPLLQELFTHGQEPLMDQDLRDLEPDFKGIRSTSFSLVPDTMGFLVLSWNSDSDPRRGLQEVINRLHPGFPRLDPIPMDSTDFPDPWAQALRRLKYQGLLRHLADMGAWFKILGSGLWGVISKSKISMEPPFQLWGLSALGLWVLVPALSQVQTSVLQEYSNVLTWEFIPQISLKALTFEAGATFPALGRLIPGGRSVSKALGLFN